MNSSKSRLAELTTRSLASLPEARAAAKDDLLTHLETQNRTDAEIESAILSIEKSDKGWARRHWRTILYGMVLGLICIGIFDAWNIKQQMKSIRLANAYDGPQSEPLPSLNRSNLSASDSLLLHGDPSAHGYAERWRALWESDQNNPAYLSEYIRGILQDKQPIPDDLMAQAARIDPDNGWFLTIKAASSLKDVMEQEKLSAEDHKALKAQRYTISDEKTFLDAMSMFHLAADMPKYESYATELTSKRIALLGRPDNYPSFLHQMAFTASITSHGALELMEFQKAISAQATRCAEQKDKAELERTIATWKKTTRAFAQDSTQLIEGLIARVLLYGPTRNFRDAALACDTPTLAEHFAQMAITYQAERDRRMNADHSKTEDLVTREGSLIACLSLPMIDSQIQHPPILAAHDFLPSRLAEHAYSMSLAMRTICLVLLIIAATLGIRMACLPSHALGISKVVIMTVPLKDWIFVLLLGGLSPMLVYFALQYVTPLSTREWGPRLFGIHQFLAMQGSLLILMITLSTALGSMVCDRRLGVWLAPSRFPKMRWILVICAFAGLLCLSSINLVIHQFSASDPAMLLLITGCCLSGVPVLWLLIRIAMKYMGKGNPAVRHATSIRMQFPVWAVAILSCAMTIPLLHLEESHWLAKDRLLVATPEKPSMTAREWDVSRIFIQELLDVLAPPQP